ncbi:MAG: hypothetical protein IJH77_02870, partial [Mogibacterium sp.]|nr:hypothetical protein [Mogibacterium sp.]
ETVRLLRLAVDYQLLDAVHYYTDHDVLAMDQYHEVLEYAQKKKAMEIVALLLEYRSRHDEIDVFDKYQL